MATANQSELPAQVAPPLPPLPQQHGQCSWVQVEKGMLSRVLYPNPVCLLSAWDKAAKKASVMTITWLTPINNQVGYEPQYTTRRQAIRSF